MTNISDDVFGARDISIRLVRETLIFALRLAQPHCKFLPHLADSDPEFPSRLGEFARKLGPRVGELARRLADLAREFLSGRGELGRIFGAQRHGYRLRAATPFFQLNHSIAKNRRGAVKALADICQRSSDFLARRIFDKFTNGGIGLANQMIHCGMHLQIAIAGSLAPHVRRYELVNLGEGAVGPAGPNDAKLLAHPLERAPCIAKKIIPVYDSPACTPRSRLGVQYMTQPDETAGA